MQEQIVFGAETRPVTLPDNVITAPPGLATRLTPTDNIPGAIQQALQNPLGRPPLHQLVVPGSRVAIAFDDPTVPCFAPVWEPAIKLVIAELEKGGVKRSNITLVSAGGIHRKFTRLELAKIIGEDLVKEFGYRLICHDAEDQNNLSYLGTTPNGYEVEINVKRLAAA